MADAQGPHQVAPELNQCLVWADPGRRSGYAVRADWQVDLRTPNCAARECQRRLRPTRAGETRELRSHCARLRRCGCRTPETSNHLYALDHLHSKSVACLAIGVELLLQNLQVLLVSQSPPTYGKTLANLLLSGFEIPISHIGSGKFQMHFLENTSSKLFVSHL
jgi:hypothetical protein